MQFEQKVIGNGFVEGDDVFGCKIVVGFVGFASEGDVSRTGTGSDNHFVAGLEKQIVKVEILIQNGNQSCQCSIGSIFHRRIVLCGLAGRPYDRDSKLRKSFQKTEWKREKGSPREGRLFLQSASVSPYFASQLLSIALRDLVHESPEARAMIHLDSMAEFVEQNRVDQIGRK